MKLIVGLGNPGEKYENTRHNLGFVVIEKFLKDYASLEETVWENEKKLKSQISKIHWQPRDRAMEEIILVKPQTFMNNSGMAVRLVSDYYKIKSEDIWVLYDDLDISLGAIKIRFGGASGGHKGVESILEQLGSDKFWRFRFGIGISPILSENKAVLEENLKVQKKRKIVNVEKYVLGEFGIHDRNKVREMIKNGSEALQTALEKDLKTAQNRFNAH